MSIAYIALGSNLGERKQNIIAALNYMEQSGLKVLAVSSLLETEPYGVTDQPLFINAAAKIETESRQIETIKTKVEIVFFTSILLDLMIFFFRRQCKRIITRRKHKKDKILHTGNK